MSKVRLRAPQVNALHRIEIIGKEWASVADLRTHISVMNVLEQKKLVERNPDQPVDTPNSNLEFKLSALSKEFGYGNH